MSDICTYTYIDKRAAAGQAGRVDECILPDSLPPDVTAVYTAFWTLPDGRLCGLSRLLFHWTVHVDIDLIGYSDRYCFQTPELAIEAMAIWDGTGDPINWHRHPNTGRRRPDLTPASEFFDP